MTLKIFWHRLESQNSSLAILVDESIFTKQLMPVWRWLPAITFFGKEVLPVVPLQFGNGNRLRLISIPFPLDLDGLQSMTFLLREPNDYGSRVIGDLRAFRSCSLNNGRASPAFAAGQHTAEKRDYSNSSADDGGYPGGRFQFGRQKHLRRDSNMYTTDAG
ncbi:MAG: hypothetical protein WCC92_20820, partial [Candidatus Korobacteraceae bacterium]